LEGGIRDPYTDNIHDPHFSVESGNAIKPLVIEDVACMGYIDRCEQMATSYGMNRKTWK
jgi:hypothetical protein